MDPSSALPATAPLETAGAARDVCTIDLAGERVVLLAGRALFISRTATLVVADPHFGKAATFRAHGIPVPRGTTSDTLARLDALLARTAAARLLVLGDFLHHRTGRAEGTLAALAHWRARHPDLQVALVLGNHDAHAGRPPETLGFTIHETPLDEGPFRFAHEPHVAPDRHVVAGHVHPACILQGRRESVRLACFVVGSRTTVLPAFGAFTGSAVVTPRADDRLYAIADDTLFPIGPVRR